MKVTDVLNTILLALLLVAIAFHLKDLFNLFHWAASFKIPSHL